MAETEIRVADLDWSHIGMLVAVPLLGGVQYGRIGSVTQEPSSSAGSQHLVAIAFENGNGRNHVDGNTVVRIRS